MSKSYLKKQTNQSDVQYEDEQDTQHVNPTSIHCFHSSLFSTISVHC